jgi:hypothetical protein
VIIDYFFTRTSYLSGSGFSFPCSYPGSSGTTGGAVNLLAAMADAQRSFVFSTVRPLGRETQKGPIKNISSRTNLRQNFGRVSQKGSKRGRILKMFSFLYFFPYKSIETLEFSQIFELVWLQNLVLF